MAVFLSFPFCSKQAERLCLFYNDTRLAIPKKAGMMGVSCCTIACCLDSDQQEEERIL
jgi:hypothetical protein